MPTFAVTYIYDDRSAERDTHRAAHRAHLQFLKEDGQILASGPLTDPQNPGALLIVRAADADGALDLLKNDPFLREGLIAERRVMGWDPVIGPWAG